MPSVGGDLHRIQRDLGYTDGTGPNPQQVVRSTTDLEKAGPGGRTSPAPPLRALGCNRFLICSAGASVSGHQAPSHHRARLR
jgi:hypothetical protein